MSDRREAVARAIYAATEPEAEWANEAAWLRADYLSQADAAIAAMQTAEPTEAEIEAARHEYITKLDAYIESAKANADCQCYSRDAYPECVETIYENAGHEAMRAALLAARNARHE